MENSSNNNGKGHNFQKMKNNSNRSGSVMYVIYVAIILVLGYFLLSGDSNSPKEIESTKFSQILEKQDCDRIVVVNGEFAEVYIKTASVRKDTAYKDLRGNFENKRTKGNESFYIYKFASLEGMNSEINEARNIIIQRDTTGKGLSEQEKREVISKTRFNQTSDKRTDVWSGVLSFMWPILILVLFFVVMNVISRRQMGGGGGGIFSVGKSRAQMYDAKTQTNITFKDVAGLAEAKVEIMEIVDFLKNPKKYTSLGGKIPKGALLVGPPGTGKTLLAKAVAGEARVPFFSMSGSDFVEMFVGVGASRVRDLFKTAKEKAPCIIFIDEIDAIGRARGRSAISGSNDERENTLNQLLTEMDGFGTNAGVIIMAATNRADVLDKALLRAGRFDRQIYVELPDIEERKEIFDVHMRGLKLDDSVDRDFLSRQTPGFSGADIANVCNEAALIAARHNKDKITKQDFLDAVDRIVGGLEKRTKVITPHEKKVIAYHESGHASVSWLLRWGNPLVKVTIVPRGKALGAAWYLPEERQITTYDQMFDDITSLLAGRAAEEIVFGEISTGALNDLERATKQAMAMVTYYGLNKTIGNISYYDSTGQTDMAFTKPFSEKTAETIDAEVHKMLESAYQRAKSLLVENRDKLDQLAQQLISREVIFREDLEQIYGKRPFDDEEKTVPSAAEDNNDAESVKSGQTEGQHSPDDNEPASITSEQQQS